MPRRLRGSARSRHAPRWPLAVAVALLLAGCALQTEDGAAALGLPSPQCASDSECAPGTYCQPEHRLCVASNPKQVEVAIAVAPPVETKLVPAHVAGVTINVGEPLDLVLPETVRVQGVVKVEGNNLQPSIPCTIVAVAKEPVIAGTWLRTQTQGTHEGYELLLQANMTYSVTVMLDVEQSDFPRPKYRTELSFGAGDAVHDFFLPQLKQLPEVRGRIKRMENGAVVPQPGVLVTAMSADTKEECTSATTDALGQYVIRCPLTFGKHYTIRASAVEGGPVIPTFDHVLDAYSFTEKLEQVRGARIEVNGIVLPEMAATERKVLLEGTRDGVTEPAAGVPIVVAAEAIQKHDVWSSAYLRITATTDASGHASVPLLESVDGQAIVYHVSVRPAPSSTWRIREVGGWQLAATTNLAVELEPKGELTGRVLSHSGGPVALADVFARTTITDTVTGIGSLREYVASTDEAGEFKVPIDAGTYTFAVKPPDASGLPRWSGGPQEVAWTGTTLEVHLAPPSILDGTILDPSGALPVGRVTVEIYDDCGTEGTARLLGRGVSGEDGRYFVILPAL